MTRVRGLSALLAAIMAAALLTGCADNTGNTGNTGQGASQETLIVFAAASLKSSFTELAERFETENPGTRVTLSFAGSPDLATQISQGAPADVFASADATNMAKLKDAGMLQGEPLDFATNTLAIAVPAGNPARIRTFADLAKSGTKLVMCARQVPCGAAAAAVEQQTGTDLTPVSEENSVADVLGKVTSGEADAGLVYVTDVRAAGGKVESVPFPEAAGTVITYPIAMLAAGRNKAAAGKFLELVAGPDGRRILAAAGFGPGR